MPCRSAWQWQGRSIELVDTAGLRRRARIEPGGLERLSSRSALAALREADVVMLMVDASAPLEQQDITIANRAAEAGRALIVAANKWDLVAEPEAALALLRERLEGRLPHLKGIACLPISVRTGKNLERLLPLVIETASAGRCGSRPRRSIAGSRMRSRRIRRRSPKAGASSSATPPR